MAAASEHLITRVEVHEVGAHDAVKVWNRGGLAGTLTVTRGDGARVADRLAPEDSIITMKYGIRTWVPMKLGETDGGPCGAPTDEAWPKVCTLPKGHDGEHRYVGEYVEEKPDLKGFEESNTLCSVCKTRQYISPSGLFCKNGHGGADPL